MSHKDVKLDDDMRERAWTVGPGDQFLGKEVRWVMRPLAAGVSALLPDGGVLITFTDSTQLGVERSA